MSALLDRAAQLGAAVRFGLLEQGATLRAAAADKTERAVRAVVDAFPVGTYSLAFVRDLVLEGAAFVVESALEEGR